MASILFLDDMEDRHREFMRAVRGTHAYAHAVVRVYTARDAIKALESQRFDQVFLDHDLSLDDIMIKVGADSKVPTGMQVVDHILKMEHPPGHVVVHSCNGPAAREMEDRLRESTVAKVDRIPFPDLLSRIRMGAS